MSTDSQRTLKNIIVDALSEEYPEFSREDIETVCGVHGCSITDMKRLLEKSRRLAKGGC